MECTDRATDADLGQVEIDPHLDELCAERVHQRVTVLLLAGLCLTGGLDEFSVHAASNSGSEASALH